MPAFRDSFSMKKLVLTWPAPEGARAGLGRLAAESLGPRRAAHAGSRKRLGIERERYWFQGAHSGDLIAIVEGPDPGKSMTDFVGSRDPYDAWFKDVTASGVGVDWAKPLPLADALHQTTDGAGKETVALVTPILPDKTEVLLQLVKEIEGPRRAAHEDLRRRSRLAEDWFLRRAPGGDVKITYFEAAHLATAVGNLVRSTQPHDVWLKDRLLEIEGIDWNAPLPTSMPVELFGWRA